MTGALTPRPPVGTIPLPRYPTSLHVRDWLRLDDHVVQITDLVARHGGGRIVHLSHRHPPLLLDRDETVDVYVSVLAQGAGRTVP